MASKTEMAWLDRLLAWRGGGWAGPVRVILFPTNRCNLRCSICWQRDFGVDPGELSEERLLRLVDECAELGVQEWLLVGGGEPLVRADTVTAVARRIRARGMNGSIQTNGTMLRDRHMEEFIDMGWSGITVSLDGPDEETNDAIRSHGSFAGAVKAMRRLTELKQQRGSTLPRLTINVTVTRLNAHRAEDLFELAREVGCDGDVIFCDLIVTGEQTRALAPSEEDLNRLSRYARMLSEHEWPYPFRSNLAGEYADPGARRNSGRACRFNRGDLGGASCYEPWLSMVVMPDGRVGPCCVMWAPDLDSLAEKTVEEVWRGPYMEKVRRLMRDGEAPDYCANCPSGLVANAERQRVALWEHVRWSEGGWVARSGLLMRKALLSTRRNGVRHLVHRGREWLRMQRNLRRSE